VHKVFDALIKTLKMWSEEALSGSGARTTSVPVMPNAGAVPDPTETIQKQTVGGKLIQLSEYNREAFGQGENYFAKMGVA